jgi:uncharacterized protein YbaR (Trm112 family)
MNIDNIDWNIIICPKCESNIQPFEDSIRCTNCSEIYRIKKSIPRFVGDDNYTDSFGFQWNLYKKTQIDKFNGLSISKDRFYKETQWEEGSLKNKCVLECGSGAGRFTQILCDAGAVVYSIDYSNAV